MVQKNDIVIDANVMSLYDKPKKAALVNLFKWLKESGTLTCSRSLVAEYGRSTNTLIFVLINELSRDKRYNLIGNHEIKNFRKDRHFKYTCNGKDIPHARLVFLSFRKRLITLDSNLKNDINNFRKIDKKSPCSCSEPATCCLC